MTRAKIVATMPMQRIGYELLAPAADVTVAPDTGAATLYGLIGDIDILIVRSKLPDDLFERPHRLLGVVRHGTGLDMIPVAAASAQAIPVANVPGVNANGVAEYCVGALLSLARRLHTMDRDLRDIGWNEARAHSDVTFELSGRTIGIVGVGDIGRRLAEICRRGFGMRVLGYQRRREALPSFVEYSELDDLFANADAVALCCPLTQETRGLVNARRLRAMKPQALIVNPARGPVIDEAALVQALRERWIGGAALDVFDTQPLPRDHPFLTLDNVLLTPHAAGLTQEASQAMSRGAAEESLRLLAGERPINLVNPEIWAQSLERRKRLRSDRSE